MTCIRFNNAIICVSPYGRLRLGKRYVWVDYHEYCGPQFSWDTDGRKLYDPADENDPIWPLFEAWLKKYEAKKAKRKKSLANPR